jgi:FAD/FMN-containing dehydrogenase
MSAANPLHSAITQGFRERLQAEVFLPGEAAYEDARRAWNGRFDPHPAAVVRCRTAEDVVAALDLAGERNLAVSVKGGGHSYAGHSVGDGALAIDLSLMNSVKIDPDRRRAVVGPGATWAEFDQSAQAFGLAATGATVSTVGVAGSTLGGGTGYLARKYGLSLDSLAAVEVVVADGRILRASEAENPDLFWALRGGSGNFGVVTSFEFRVHPVGPEVVTAQAFHPIERASDVLRFYRDFMDDAADEVNAYAFVLRVPPAAPFPEEFQGKPALALVACYCGETAAGEEALRLLRDFGEPFLAVLQTVPYVAAQKAFDVGMPEGLRWYSRAHYLRELSDEVIETVVRYTEALPGPFTMAYFERAGGAVGRVDPSATAFPHRGSPYAIHIFPGWTDPAEDEHLMHWTRDFHRALAPYATGGVYVNLLGEDEPERVSAAFGQNYSRLRELKARWDPENRFRINHNVQP